jgi:predicted house-cleaning noncanonical NTP pyrophosphatase (MazG superfamily)
MPTQPDADLRIVLATPSFRPTGFQLASPAEAGAKGAGLLRLPPAWYPPTLVINTEAHKAFKQGIIGRHFLSDSDRAPELAAVLSRLGKLGSQKSHVFVRSSAMDEGMAERGKYESIASPTALTDLESTIAKMWDDVEDPSIHLGLIIQPVLDAKVFGHLSNEYRVSRDATAWVSDMQVGNQVQTRTWRVVNSTGAADGALLSATVKVIEPRLRSVAKRLSELPSRYHLEWIWSGDRTWIVQADRVPKLLGVPPGDAWQPAVGIPMDGATLSRWTVLGSGSQPSLADWSKAAALNEFARADLPIAQVWRLQGTKVINDLAEGRKVEGLADDLEKMCSGHIVVRTDVKGTDEQVMLPKTATESDPAVVEAFLRNTSAALLGSGELAENVSFLAHRYLRARACAWTLARPRDPYVEVDSMWGTPDGLAWLPHDSSWVNVDTAEVRRSIEGKTFFLDIDEGGIWTYRESPTEWIWRASMTEDQLRTVAAGASRLANLVGAPVMTMWFVGMLDGPDVDCLPWFQTKNIPPDSEERGQFSPASKRTAIRTLADLEGFDSAIRSGSPEVIRLEPGPELVRDKSFVQRVTEVALAHNVTVELVGSSLAHPYYVLRAAGVTVSCVGQFEQPQVRFNKLVRDNIVEQIESNGETVISYRASGAAYAKLLRLKAVEEAMELLRAETLDDTLAEMADIEEVIVSLRRSLGVSRDDLRQRQTEKRARRGGFGGGQVLVRAGRRESNTIADIDPLFDDSPAEERPWQVQQRVGSVLLSNLPPLAGEQHTFLTQLGRRKVSIEYRRADIEIRLVDDDSDLSGANVTLFDDPDDPVAAESS